MIARLFVEHPKTVGESYMEHMGQAFSFGMTMILAGIACLLHGLVPGWFVKTGSITVTGLHERMVLNRRRHPAEATSSYDFVI